MYGAILSTDCPFAINAPEFTELPLLGQLGTVEFLYVRSNAPLTWRFNGTVPTLVGGENGNVPTVYPVTFVAPVELAVEITGVGSLNVQIPAGSYTAAQLANVIDSEFALAGFVDRPAFVASGSGQLGLRGFSTGRETVVAVVGGSAQVPLGFAPPNDQAVGGGNDVVINGLGMFEFGRDNPLSRVQVRGTASQVMVLAAGTPR